MRRRSVWIPLLAVVVLGAGFLVVRGSSLVEIREVQVTGATGPEAEEIERRLTTEAREMTTLAFDADRLEEVAARYPLVQAVEARTEFPHGLRIRVRERTPVAALGSGAGRILVSGDGRLLRGVRRRDVPALPGEVPLSGGRVVDGRTLAAIRVLAAAPARLRARIQRANTTEDGVVLEMADGPELRFGRDERLAAKWAATARVLADESSRGALYLDVRLPGRPAAGGLEDPAAQLATTTNPQPVVESP